jgi:hypothetical protein
MQIIVIFPNPRLVSEINITNDNLNQTLVKINLPEKIWFGQTEKINIQLINEKSQNGFINGKQDLSDFDSRKIQNFEVDLVMTGAELTPPGISIMPIIEGKDIIMNWRIEPISNQGILGTVWIYINTFSNDNKKNLRELIFTKNISIKTKNILDLKIVTIQWILSFLTLLNIIYLFCSFKKLRSLKVS